MRRWLKSTSNQTFAVYPVVLLALEAAIQQGWPRIAPLGVPFLVWGYLQYRLVGRYRTTLGSGGPGIAVPPDRIVDQGPYRYTRNPMYLGHLIFMLGLAITLRSWLALLLLAFHLVWFQRRVIEDGTDLEQIFGPAYRDYKKRVKRWIPGAIELAGC